MQIINNNVSIDILELESNLIFHPAKEFQNRESPKLNEKPKLEKISKTKTNSTVTVNLKGDKAKLVFVGNKNNNSNNSRKSCCCMHYFLILSNPKDPSFFPLCTIVVCLFLLLFLIIVVPIIIVTQLSGKTQSNGYFSPITTKSTTITTTTTSTTKITTSVPFVNVSLVGLSNLVETNMNPLNSTFTYDVILIFLNYHKGLNLPKK